MLQTGWSDASEAAHKAEESRCVSVWEKVSDIVKRVDRIEGSGERKEDDVSQVSVMQEIMCTETVGGQLQRTFWQEKMTMAGLEVEGGWRRLEEDPLATHCQIARTPTTTASDPPNIRLCY